MELRGYDSYEISLGDEMRGERASLNKSLEDVERDLRIKARMLVAIEECDLSAFTNPSVVSGYVRSYARYLGMDVEDVYQRFCDYSGFRSPAALMSKSGDGSGFGSLSAPVNSHAGAQIANSRFTAPPSRNRFRARLPLGALASGLALIGLIAGLSYGGYSLLQDIQRVAIAPVPDAPAVVANAPAIAALSPREDARPSASAYAGGGALAAVPEPSQLEIAAPPRRDGPISAIDPNRASIFRRNAPEEPKAMIAALAVDIADTRDYGRSLAVVDAPPTGLPNPGPEAEPVERGIRLFAAGAAWIKVMERDRSTIWQGTLEAGQEFTLPDQVVAAKVRSGNAGKTYVILDGTAYGPLGGEGRVVKNVSLLAADIRDTLPEADLSKLRADLGEDESAVARANN